MNAVSEPSLNQTSRWNKVTVALLSALLLVVSVLHYATPKPWVHFHTLYREVYFLIVIAAAYLGGLKPGLITAGVISAIYAPHVWMTWKAQPGVNVGNLFQIFLYFLSAATLGVLRDREKRRLMELQHAWSMASLGRAALALSAEIHDLLRMAREILRKEYVADPTRKDLQKIMKKLSVLDQSLAHFDPSALEEPQDFIDLDSALEARLPQLQSLAAERQVNLRFDPQGAGSLVYGRKEDLVWVAEQLIRNAAEASSPGKTIRVETHSDGEGYHLIVRDEGPGIAEENLSKVFTPFFSTKQKGTGLGLSVCKKIVSDHGGSIDVESRTGQGTTFHVVLPPAFGEREEPSGRARP